MKFYRLKSIVTCIAMMFIVYGAFAQEHDATTVSERAAELLAEITKYESSSAEAEGMTQLEYDKYLGALYAHLSMDYFKHLQYETALVNCQTSLSYYVKTDNWTDKCFVYKFIATIAGHMERYQVAEDALSTAILEARGLDDMDALVELLVEYQKLAKQMRDYDKENRITVELLSIDKTNLSLATQLDMIRYGLDYASDIGDTEMQLAYIEEYRNMIASIPDPDVHYMVILYQYEAQYFQGTGMYTEAAECYERIMPHISSPSILIQYYVQAMYCHANAGNVAGTDEYVEKIEALASDPDITAQTMASIRINEAICLLILERYDEALAVIELVGPEEPYGQYYYIYKGNILGKVKRYEEALEAYEAYSEICREQYGAESMKYAKSLQYLAHTEGFLGKTESGSAHMEESLRLIETIVRRDIPYVSSDMLEGYWSEISSGISHMAGYSVASGIDQGELTVAAYEGLVLSKGILLASERSFTSYVMDSEDPQLQELYRETVDLRDRMEYLKRSYALNKEEIMGLQPELASMESRLAQYGPQFSEYIDYLSVRYDDLRSALKDGEVVIDFVDHETEDKGRRYLAFVYRKDWKAPKIIRICSQDDLDAYDISGMRPDVLYGVKQSSELLDLIWKPLEKYLHKGDVVYLIPSGDLHLISFDSFQTRKGVLLGDRYDIVRLSTARELLGDSDSENDVRSAVLYGGLQYDLTDAERSAQSQKYRGRFGRERSLSRRRGGETFDFLPMTREEVLSVEERLREAGISDLTCYVGIEGTEESFLSLGSPSPDILHVATHGFYYSPEDASRVPGLSGYKNAMRLSGLVFAGGNAEWQGLEVPANSLGGILSAEDIASCDLSGTDLVFLTACDTGKGHVASDGVYGIQRAFKKAGVQTMILNLWSVDDAAAKDFVDFFYASYASNGWDKRIAFKSAKAQMREKYRSPYYWAGYVMLD